MTYEEAIAKCESGWWQDATPEQIVEFQLYEERLCMPFDKFREAVEQVLGRPVFTHELASLKLLEDYERVKMGQPSAGPDFSVLDESQVLTVVIDDQKQWDAPKQEPAEESGLTMGGQSL